MLALVLSALLAVPAAFAEDPPDAEAVAVQAAEIAHRHCSDVASAASVGAAEALNEVSPVLVAVARAYETHGDPFLLFWKGVLNQCLDQEDRATEDFEGFLAGVGDDAAYSAQVRDARLRLRRLTARQAGRSARGGSGASPAGPVGVVFVSSGAGVAILGAALHASAFQEAALTQAADGGWTSTHSGDPTEWAALQDRNRTGLGVLVGGSVLAVAGVAVAISAASDARQAVLVPWGAPSGRGVVLGIGGRF